MKNSNFSLIKGSDLSAKFTRTCRMIFALLFVSICVSGITAYSNLDLQKALRENDKKKVSEILERGGSELRKNVNLNASFYLPLAARFGSADLVDLMIKRCNYQQEKRAINEALVTSIDNDHFAEVVPLLIAYGANASHEHSEMTALGRIGYLYAGEKALSGKVVKTARLLLEKGAYIDLFDQTGMTLLMAACEADDLPLVNLCMEYGANPNLSNKDCKSPLTLAKPGSKVARALKKKKGAKDRLEIELLGQKFGQESLGQDMDLTPKWAGEDSVYTGPTETPAKFREDPKLKIMQLSEAASSGNADRVKELLDQGVDANSSVDVSGITFLMQAANAKITRLLLNAGASAKRTDSSGWSALHYAATRKADSIMITLLLKAGADISSRTNNGETPLRLTGILFTEKISPTWGNTLIPLLVNAGADINSADNEGHTLLHQAAFNNNADLARVCVLMGADPDLKTIAGKSPRQAGKELGSRKFMKAIQGK